MSAATTHSDCESFEGDRGSHSHSTSAGLSDHTMDVQAIPCVVREVDATTSMRKSFFDDTSSSVSMRLISQTSSTRAAAQAGSANVSGLPLTAPVEEPDGGRARSDLSPTVASAVGFANWNATSTASGEPPSLATSTLASSVSNNNPAAQGYTVVALGTRTYGSTHADLVGVGAWLSGAARF